MRITCRAKRHSEFVSDNHKAGKIHTAGIEGNNCRLRHRIRRAFFYINSGFA
jgi:IS1 family transposase